MRSKPAFPGNQGNGEKMTDSQSPKRQFIIGVLLRLISGIGAIAALLFLPAGTFQYWQAWVLLGTLVGLMHAEGEIPTPARHLVTHHAITTPPTVSTYIKYT